MNLQDLEQRLQDIVTKSSTYQVFTWEVLKSEDYKNLLRELSKR
jgi:hypothetical protein